jgi:hypothetical protein
MTVETSDAVSDLVGQLSSSFKSPPRCHLFLCRARDFRVSGASVQQIGSGMKRISNGLFISWRWRLIRTMRSMSSPTSRSGSRRTGGPRLAEEAEAPEMISMLLSILFSCEEFNVFNFIILPITGRTKTLRCE